jgi:hypothetical protein
MEFAKVPKERKRRRNVATWQEFGERALDWRRKAAFVRLGL